MCLNHTELRGQWQRMTRRCGVPSSSPLASARARPLRVFSKQTDEEKADSTPRFQLTIHITSQLDYFDHTLKIMTTSTYPVQTRPQLLYFHKILLGLFGPS